MYGGFGARADARGAGVFRGGNAPLTDSRKRTSRGLGAETQKKSLNAKSEEKRMPFMYLHEIHEAHAPPRFEREERRAHHDEVLT